MNERFSCPLCGNQLIEDYMALKVCHREKISHFKGHYPVNGLIPVMWEEVSYLDMFSRLVDQESIFSQASNKKYTLTILEQRCGRLPHELIYKIACGYMEPTKILEFIKKLYKVRVMR